jgi:hypothetical protein
MGVCIPLLRMRRMRIALFCACSVPNTLWTQTQILIMKSCFHHFNSSHRKCQYVAPDTTAIFPQYPNNGTTAEHSRNYASTLTLLLGFRGERTRRNSTLMPRAHFLTVFNPITSYCISLQHDSHKCDHVNCPPSSWDGMEQFSVLISPPLKYIPNTHLNRRIHNALKNHMNQVSITDTNLNYWRA